MTYTKSSVQFLDLDIDPSWLDSTGPLLFLEEVSSLGFSPDFLPTWLFLLCLLLISHHLLDLLMFMSTRLSAITLISLMISCLMIFRHTRMMMIFQFVSPAQIFPAIWLVHPVFPLDTNSTSKSPCAKLNSWSSQYLLHLQPSQLCWGQYHLSSCSALKPQSSPRFLFISLHTCRFCWPIKLAFTVSRIYFPTTSTVNHVAPGHLHHCAGCL